jgi:predicted DNA-binding transcriptional regulator YafY
MAAQRSMMLFMQLAARERVTAAELAEALGVNVRTIYRDVELLRSCGFTVEGTPRVGYSLGETGRMPPLLLPDDELRALIAGAYAMRNSSDEAIAHSAKALLARLRRLVPPRSRAGLGLKA